MCPSLSRRQSRYKQSVWPSPSPSRRKNSCSLDEMLSRKALRLRIWLQIESGNERCKAREYFEAANKKTREDLERRFISSSTIGVRAIERQGRKVGDVTEATVMQLPSIAVTFASFVAASLRKSDRARRK